MKLYACYGCSAYGALVLGMRWRVCIRCIGSQAPASPSHHGNVLLFVLREGPSLMHNLSAQFPDSGSARSTPFSHPDVHVPPFTFAAILFAAGARMVHVSSIWRKGEDIPGCVRPSTPSCRMRPNNHNKHVIMNGEYV